LTGAKNIITVKDGSGNQKWTNQTDVPVPSMLPNTPRIINVKDNAGLPAGSYSVKSDITLANGNLVDTKTVSFTVIDPPPIPAAPVLTSPGNSSIPGLPINTTTPTMQWNAVTGADYYILSIYRDPYGAGDAVYQDNHVTGISTTLASGAIFAGEKYAWEVSAVNITGTGNKSNRFYFQVTGNAPSVSTVGYKNNTESKATLGGYLDGRGNTSSVNVSFEYGTTTSYGSTTTEQNLSAAGPFSADISGLTPSTTYHFRAKAVGSSIVYGADKTFTTTSPLSVSTSQATNITTTSSTLNGNLISLGSDSSVNVSFEYGTTTGYGSTTTPQSFTAAGTYSADISSLTPNTTYHFRAKAVGSAATVYGDDKTFITTTAASISTLDADNITATSSILNGNLISLGSDSNAIISFEYGTTSSYGYTTPEQNVGIVGQFSNVISGLTPNTTYHFRAKAVGSSKTVYGDDKTFVTLQDSGTTVKTTKATTKTSTTTKSSAVSGIAPDDFVKVNFAANETLHVDAVDQDSLEVNLTGVNTSNTGSITVGKYKKEPATSVAFSDTAAQGGTDMNPVKFVYIRVEGYLRGTARVTIHFTDEEIAKYNPDTLALFYFSNNKWNKCTNIDISLTDHIISADIPVLKLTGTVVGLGGSTGQSSTAIVPFVSQSNNGTTGHGVSWGLVGIIIGIIIIVGGVILIVEKNRRETSGDR
jgi:hypothetical protein